MEQDEPIQPRLGGEYMVQDSDHVADTGQMGGESHHAGNQQSGQSHSRNRQQGDQGHDHGQQGGDQGHLPRRFLPGYRRRRFL